MSTPRVWRGGRAGQGCTEGITICSGNQRGVVFTRFARGTRTAPFRARSVTAGRRPCAERVARRSLFPARMRFTGVVVVVGALAGACGGSSGGGSGQPTGSAGGTGAHPCSDLFDPNTLRTYSIDITPDEWTSIQAEFHDLASLTVQGNDFVVKHAVVFHMGGETVTGAMFKLHGQSSWVQTVMYD